MKSLFTKAAAILLCAAMLALAACTKPAEQPQQDPAPTGTEQTSPSPEPKAEGYNEDEVKKLAAYFETADADGVKNGDKLFIDYDPADPATWISPVSDGTHDNFTWNDEGRLVRFDLLITDGSAKELAGKLEITDFSALEYLNIANNVTIESIEINNCPALDSAFVWATVIKEVDFDNPAPAKGLYFDSVGVICCNIGGGVPTDKVIEGDPKDVKITLVSDSNGRVAVNCYEDDSLGEMVLKLLADSESGYEFSGWYLETAELYSAEEVLDITNEEPPLGGEFCLQAEFTPIRNAVAMYEGDEAPTASAIIAEIEPGKPYEADIDFDGRPDAISLEPIGEYDEDYLITVKLGAFHDEPFTYECYGITSCALRLLDCDTSDNRLDLLFNGFGEDGWEVVFALRADDETGKIVQFKLPVQAEIITDSEEYEDAHGNFDATQGIPVWSRTEILDTQFVSSRMTVTNDGFRLLTPYVFDEPYTGSHGYRPLKMEMTGKLMTSPSGDVTLAKGTKIIPYRTDGQSWLEVKTEDGRIVMVLIDVKGGRVWINGIEQNKYCEIWVAD
ncbi:MAG: hypothetical protein IJM18_01775 [Clostridia bacterium]|nr:hypothetical protein [Clostridia bacterium]